MCSRPLANRIYTHGQTVQNAFVCLPGGAIVEYDGTALGSYLHPDWLSSPRLFSFPAQTVAGDMAYAPFGKSTFQPGYVTFWTGVGNDLLWSDMRTFPARQYENNSGRWLSPDPLCVCRE